MGECTVDREAEAGADRGLQWGRFTARGTFLFTVTEPLTLKARKCTSRMQSLEHLGEDPPPPEPVQWAPVTLQGIWREPEPEPTQEHDPDASSSSMPRTSTTSTTSMMTSTTSTTGAWVNILENQTAFGGDPTQSVSSLLPVEMPNLGVAVT